MHRCLKCGNCCSIMVCTKQELSVMAEELKKKSLAAIYRNEATCLFLGLDFNCMVYSFRPPLCRMFGHTDKMLCMHNPNADRYSQDELKAWTDQLPPLIDQVRLNDPAAFLEMGLHIFNTKGLYTLGDQSVPNKPDSPIQDKGKNEDKERGT